MKFKFFNEPVSFCIIKKFYSDDEVRSIHEELERLEPHFKDGAFLGTARTITGEPKKSNKGLFLDDYYGTNREKSAILSLNRRVFSPEVLYELEKRHWMFKYLRKLNVDTTLISVYKDGDYYRPHEDKSFFTAIYYTWKDPKPFDEGDLYFGKFKVPVKNNSVIIFPSNTMHEVTPVRGHGRYAISQFISMHPEKIASIKPFEKYPNFLNIVDFKKVQEIISRSDWSYIGRTIPDGVKFLYTELNNNPFFTEYLANKISQVSKLKLKLARVYANGQAFGQNGSFHQDDSDENAVSALLYTNEINESVLDEWGGETQFKVDGDIISCQPVTNTLIIFKSNIFHRGLAPSRFAIDMRVTIAWKFYQ